jgi:uncharacterized membrane protein YgcG
MYEITFRLVGPANIEGLAADLRSGLDLSLAPSGPYRYHGVYAPAAGAARFDLSYPEGRVFGEHTLRILLDTTSENWDRLARHLGPLGSLLAKLRYRLPAYHVEVVRSTYPGISASVPDTTKGTNDMNQPATATAPTPAAAPAAPAAAPAADEQVAVVYTRDLGFFERLVDTARTLVEQHMSLGVKIGSSTFIAKRIVKLAKRALRNDESKYAHRAATIIETRLGGALAVMVVPSLTYGVARIFPNFIPKADRVQSVSGYAVAGAVSETVQVVLDRAGPFFSEVASLADDYPIPVKGDVKDESNAANGSAGGSGNRPAASGSGSGSSGGGRSMSPPASNYAYGAASERG